ncbi:MAG: 50S ribosomal protein L9 [Chloroflexaceae bacterium]|nr:50S ribosomal protein L9 [Chloroflexaceae bacterium]NJL33084.1 50S ribosomal protein L9 [Chloroflexaceae bacterium]
MKILLTQDVEKVGKSGDVKWVAGGFGRNYLIPKGMAVLATPGQVKQAEERIAARRRREAVARRDSEAIASRLNGVTLRFREHVGELDRLYGSVTNADIAERIRQQLDLEIDRRKIALGDPIKRIGVYPVQIRLAADLIPVVNVVVEAAEGEGMAVRSPTADAVAVPADIADLEAHDTDDDTDETA